MGSKGPGPASVSGCFQRDEEKPPSANIPPGGPMASILPDPEDWTSSSSAGLPLWLWSLQTSSTSSDWAGAWGLRPHFPKH